MALFFSFFASPTPSLGASKPTSDFRKELQHAHVQQRYGWVIFIIILSALLFLFSAGFFLYTALVVGVLFIFSLIMASLSIIGIQINRRVSNNQINLGEAVDAWLTVTNKKNLPAFWMFWKDHVDSLLDVEGATCQFKTIAGQSKHELKYRLHSTRRGLFRVGPTVMESSGPFGLVRRFLVGSTVDFITVLPRVIVIGSGLAQGQRPVHQVPRRRSIFEDPSRFIGMREYQPGDSMRRIHWRATARSGTLQVKLFEPAVFTGILLAVDMGLASYPQTRGNSKEIDPLLELTISTAASLSQYVLAGDQETGLISNGTDAAELFPGDWQGGTFHRLEQVIEHTHLRPPTAAYLPVEIPASKGVGQQERMLKALARLTPSTGIPLPDLLNTELPRLPRNKVLMIITPQLDSALYVALESIKRSGIEAGLIWIRLPGDFSPVPGGLPQHIPIYIVQREEDIQQLGGQRL